jgi:hypothetical protein
MLNYLIIERKAEDETSERPSKLIIKEIEKVGVAGYQVSLSGNVQTEKKNTSKVVNLKNGDN